MVTKELAMAGLDKMKEWGTWLVTIQTAGIGGLAFAFKAGPIGLTEWQKTWAGAALICFGASILAASWVVGCVPSVLARLKENSSAHNDIYCVDVFSFDPIRLVAVATLEHTFFILGILSFAIFVYTRLG